VHAKSRHNAGFDPSIRRHRAADEAVLNNVNKKKLLRFAELSPNPMHKIIKMFFPYSGTNSNKLVFPNVRQGISQIIRNDSWRGV
jgi:hypothetical protein